LNRDGRVIALDQDIQAVEYGRAQFAHEGRLEIVHCNFRQVADVIAKRGWAGKVDGVLMDLGVSSPQLDDPGRGFSFMRSGPLDMRMDTTTGMSAMQWLAQVKTGDLAYVLRKYGEEKSAKRIAQAIVSARATAPLTETGQLAAIIEQAVPGYEKHKHPATRSFQAIRIFINDELQVLMQGLEAAASVLAVGGRLAVISFHSLEDRIVKRFMRDLVRGPQLPPGLPLMDAHRQPDWKLLGKPVTAEQEELERNPRARSARLRVMERMR
jgi:16S rRNA (cytosine1402-N4)-methyltransferase